MIYTSYTKPRDFVSKFKVVSCFVQVGEEILLLHRQPYKIHGNQWGLPAGKVEEGETIFEAILRELREETGIEADLKLFRSLGMRFVRQDKDFDYYMHRIVLPSKPKIIISQPEHQSFCWINPKAKLGLELVPDEETCLQEIYRRG
jgi:8-oxo-dGTP diphosphatase